MIEKLPPFILPYQHGESTFYLNSNRPIKAVAAQDWAIRQIKGQETDSFFQANVSAFWIIEGFLYKAELQEADFPTLGYYLKNRDGLAMPQRWELYNDIVDVTEASEMVVAYNATRRNAFETEIETPVDEKKKRIRARALEIIKANKETRQGYKVIKTKHGAIELEETVCWQLPRDEMLELLNYDFSILERAVRLKRVRGMDEYPPLEEVLQWDDDYQLQCRIYEQVLDYASDYKKANAQG